MKNGNNNEVYVPHLWYKHLIRGKKNNIEQHCATVHSNFALLWGASYKRIEITYKTVISSLNRQNANAAKEVSYGGGHVLTKHKMPFTDGRIVKEVVTAMAIETLFKDYRSKTEMKSAIVNVQLGGKERVCCLQIR